MPRLDAIGVTVSDLREAVAFYAHLGLEFPEPGDDDGHLEASAAGLRLMLDTEDVIRSFAPDWTPPTGGHRVALAFACDSPADVDEQYRALLAAGGQPHKDPWDAFWGHRYAQVLDPSGNLVDLFAPLEGAGA